MIAECQVDINAINAWDMHRVKQLLIERYEFYPEMTNKMEREYKRFIAIRIQHPDQAIVPSHLVDEMWHTHILFTRDYIAFCEAVNGEYIHHAPFLKNEKRKHNSSIKTTLTLYINMFGQPDRDIWLKAADCTDASCGDCTSSDCGPQCE
jgi:hypothetical protein